MIDLSTAAWRKSSRSDGSGANCVEVARICRIWWRYGIRSIPTGRRWWWIALRGKNSQPGYANDSRADKTPAAYPRKVEATGVFGS